MDPACLHSSLTELFLELLYNAIKGDYSIERKSSCVKRLLQNAIHADSNTIIAVLIFINKLSAEENGLNQMLFNTEMEDDEDENELSDEAMSEEKEEVEEKKEEESGDDEEESGEGEGEEESEEEEEEAATVVAKEGDDNWEAAPVAVKGVNDKLAEIEGTEIMTNGYVFDKREPLHAKGHTACLWELIYLARHYHPTVARISRDMVTRLDSSAVSYTGNPLLDFSFVSFLNRFCLKKPKVKNAAMKEKLIERNKVAHSRIEDPFSLQKVMETAESDVREEERFIYSYFQKKLDNLGMREEVIKK